MELDIVCSPYMVFRAQAHVAYSHRTFRLEKPAIPFSVARCRCALSPGTMQWEIDTVSGPAKQESRLKQAGKDSEHCHSSVNTLSFT
jgi:hypothetical protein